MHHRKGMRQTIKLHQSSTAKLKNSFKPLLEEQSPECIGEMLKPFAKISL